METPAFRLGFIGFLVVHGPSITQIQKS
jgi:hypothetical protein